MQQSFSVYGGERSGQGYTGYLAEDNLYLVLECPEGTTNETGSAAFEVVVHHLKHSSVDNLSSFEHALLEAFAKASLPIGASLAAGIMRGEVLYLKTTGGGAIYLRRSGKQALLIGGDKTASGYCQPGDVFVFSTRQNEDDVAKVIGNEGDIPGRALVVRTLLPLAFPAKETSPALPWVNNLRQRFRENYQKLRERTEEANAKKKLLTLAVVFVLVSILVWSVGLASKRRKAEQAKRTLQETQEVIRTKLAQAEEVAFLNLPSAMVLLTESKEELTRVKESLGTDPAFSDELEQIEREIAEKENSIVKKEEKQYEEFFDLALEEKNAKGTTFARDVDDLAVLDKNLSAVYVVSLTQKSLVRVTGSDVKQAKRLAVMDDTLLLLVPGKGVIEIGEDTPSKVLIPQDPEWGTIADMAVYNKNIYLLDSGKKTVYKYLPVEEGYSDTQTYFAAGTSPDLTGSTSMAIDSSVYIGFPNSVDKFTSGLADTFNPDFPQTNVSITKVIAFPDLEQVYGWDKEKGSVYVFGKNGTYEREIQSSVLKQATDVTVYDDFIYLLSGAKIFRISL